MKVEIRIIDLELNYPEFIPLFKGIKLPTTLVVEGLPTIEEEKEQKLRIDYPDYWKNLTMMEWRLFVNLFYNREQHREALRIIMHGEVQRLIAEGWEERQESNVVDVHVKNLRMKLRYMGNLHHVVTKRGWGYQFGDGPEPYHSYTNNQEEYKLPDSFRPKKLNPDGSLDTKYYPNAKATLTAPEFQYLKEMIMDEKSKEYCAEILKVDLGVIEAAWDLKRFPEYIRRMIGASDKGARYGPRFCKYCKEEGHTKAHCPMIVVEL